MNPEVKERITNILSDKYDVYDPIYSGNMSGIYLGTHRALAKKVAIKVAIHGQSNDPKAIERFTREARLVATLNHRNIVDIHDFGFKEDLAYLIMPYIDGMTLREKITKTGQIKAEEALNIVFALTNALGCAHEKGVVHRDIKPSNIMLDKQGNVYLTDFGISKSQQDNDLTLVGTVLGTPRYMSPEQIESGVCDQRSDLYSLGLVFYEMVTGEHPIKDKSTSNILYSQLNKVPPRPSEIVHNVPDKICDIIMKLLEKSPGDRYLSCKELQQDLRTVSLKQEKEESQLSSSKRSETHVVEDGKARRQSALTSKLIFLMVIFVIGFGLLLYFNDIDLLGSYSQSSGQERNAVILESKDVQEAVVDSSGTRDLPLLDGLELFYQKAEIAFAEGRVDSPEGDNAIYYLSKLYSLSPNHGQAKVLWGEVIARYVALGEGALENDDLAQARVYLEKVKALPVEIEPYAEDVVFLADAIRQKAISNQQEAARIAEQRRKEQEAARIAEQKRKEQEAARIAEQKRKEMADRIDNLLVKARNAFKENRLNTPYNNNVVAYLSEIEKLSPDHSEVARLWGDVISRYVIKGRVALNTGKLDEATEVLKTIQNLPVNDSTSAVLVTDLKRDIENRTLKVRTLIDRATALYDESKDNNPPDSLLISIIEEVKKIDNNNSTADKLLVKIVNKYLSFAEKYLSENENYSYELISEAEKINNKYSLNNEKLIEIKYKLKNNKVYSKEKKKIWGTF